MADLKPKTATSFDDVQRWFGLLDEENNPVNPTEALGSGVAAAKYWWKKVLEKSFADPTYCGTFAASYVDLMVDVVETVRLRFERAPEFTIDSLNAYFGRLLSRRALEIRDAALNGGWFYSKDELPDEALPVGDPAPPAGIETDIENEDFLRRLRQTLQRLAKSPQELQTALIFLNLLNDVEEIDVDDLPIESRGATDDQLTKKRAIYLAADAVEQQELVTGASYTRSKAWRKRISRLDELLLSALTAIDGGDTQ